ncbi:MAG: histidinol dehydrogenase [Oscillospiraceae bacterium]|jgi:histidinol dehydrogenase|nr:histidinol dehydrogenase [Oscillospiraceae bacterium]
MIKLYTNPSEYFENRPQSSSDSDGKLSETVASILSDVKARGDAALRDYAAKFDGVTAADYSLEVTRGEIDAALSEVEPDFVRVLERAAENIRDFHSHQTRTGFITQDKSGVIMGQKVLPVARAGVYIPGGTAAYPSSALMNIIPAKIAGVPEVVMITPPGADGGIKNKYIIAAAAVAGADRIFKTGGAQGIAALAFGTETIARADKITGPGNAFVTEAKRQVYGICGIDMMAGPSDITIIADESANPRFLAADMLAQSEHDILASAILITTSETVAQGTIAEIESQLAELPRREIAGKSVNERGAVILVRDLAEAIAAANEIAPEHLEICTKSPFDLLSDVKNAGSVFLGQYTPEALGDYFSGANHTLPTLGTARFASPVSVDDFVKKTQFTYYTENALRSVAADIDSFAKKEGLDGHGKSVTVRFS